MPSITIAVCTRNGADRIQRLLGCLSRAGPDAIDDAELLIVDNASTDDTQSVVSRFQHALPIRLAVEAQPGLSHARNRALELASSDLIAFTDDDCVVGADWASNYIAASRRHPDACFFGGDIVPLFPDAPVDWIEAAIAEVPSAYARFVVGETDLEISPHDRFPKAPYGANFCFRRDRIGSLRFDPGLGRRPGSLMGGEETVFMHELLARGQRGWLLADNPVQHWIVPERQTLRYLADYYRNDGLRRMPDKPFLPGPLGAFEQAAIRLLMWPMKTSAGHDRGNARSMRRCRKLAVRLGSLEAAARTDRRSSAARRLHGDRPAGPSR